MGKLWFGAGAGRGGVTANATTCSNRERLATAPGTAMFLVLVTTALLGFVAVMSADTLFAGGQGVELAFLATVLAVVVTVPAVASMALQARRFDVVHPLFYAAWSFFLPQFVVATFLIVAGKLDTYTGWLLQDPAAARTAALKLAIIGSIGLTAGFLLPVGRRIGATLPRWRVLDLPPARLRLAALLLLALGGLGTVASFREGLFGYQVNLRAPVLGALFVFLSGLVTVGQAVIWFSFFRNRRGWRLLALLALGMALVSAVASGSRGALFIALMVVVASYLYAQERVRLRRLWKWGVVLAVGLWIGVVFGTTFRWTKTEDLGRTESLTASEVAALAERSAAEVRAKPLGENVRFGWARIIERLDGVNALGLIVANAEALRPAEEAAGIDHNIVRDFVNSLVPRFLWPGKPNVGISEEIGRLYYGTEFSSPAVTYMGDLYRNFGWGGVFPGMFLIGLVLRSIYAWLIEGHALSGVRVGTFLLTNVAVGYEGLYSTYFPSLMRLLIVCAMGSLVVLGASRRFIGSSAATPGTPVGATRRR